MRDHDRRSGGQSGGHQDGSGDGPSGRHDGSTSYHGHHGPDEATGVVLTDPLDQSLLTVVSLPSGCTEASGTIVCLVGTLGVGESNKLHFHGQVADSAPRHTRSTTAPRSAVPALTCAPRARRCVETTAVVSASADVETVKACAGPFPGGTMTYTLTATNHGPGHRRKRDRDRPDRHVAGHGDLSARLHRGRGSGSPARSAPSPQATRAPSPYASSTPASRQRSSMTARRSTTPSRPTRPTTSRASPRSWASRNRE